MPVVSRRRGPRPIPHRGVRPPPAFLLPKALVRTLGLRRTHAPAPRKADTRIRPTSWVIALEVMMDYRALFAFIDASGSPESHGDGLTVDATRVVAGQEDDRIGDFLAGDDSSGRILSRPFTPHFLKGGIVAIGLKLC